jgi:hypothetical protein
MQNYQERGGSAAISELQGFNISDLFTDFPSSSLQTETNISNVQNKPILPVFSGCTIGTINFFPLHAPLQFSLRYQFSDKQ